MTIPTVVITDHDGATSGVVSVMGPAAAHFDCYSSTFGAGDSTNVKIEWDFGDPTGWRNTIRGFSAGHFYEHEPVSDTDYTMTCTITNVDGESASATRTVRVTPNTRTLQTTLSGTIAANTEYRLDHTITHTLTVGKTWNANNILIRSDLSGTPVVIDYTSTDTVVMWASNQDFAMVDVSIISSNGKTPTNVVNFGAAVVNQSMIRCSYSLVPVSQAINLYADPIGVLIQQCVFPSASVAQCIWLGNTGNRRLVTIVDTDLTHSGTERPIRGSGIGITISGGTILYEVTATNKTCIAFPEAHWVWIHDVVFRATTNASYMISVGHSSGFDPANDIVFERCLIEQTQTQSNSIAIFVAPNTATSARCVFRNNVIIGGTIKCNTASNFKLYNNTIIQSSGVGANFVSVEIAGVAVGCVFSNNLYINPNLTLGAAALTSGTLAIATADNLATEITSVDYNITPIPLSVANGRTDVRLFGPNTNESWATFNARGIATGNLEKAVTVSGQYEIESPDSETVGAMPADMANFQEDYYGRTRSGDWVIGAVIPDMRMVYFLQAGGLYYLFQTGA